jgi:hypothetical protein
VKEIDDAVDIRNVLEGNELIAFSKEVDRRVELKNQIKELEGLVKVIDEKLLITLCEKDCDRTICGTHRVNIVTKTNTRLDKEKLLLNGVPANVIQLSTVTSQSSFLEVREIKQ